MQSKIDFKIHAARTKKKKKKVKAAVKSGTHSIASLMYFVLFIFYSSGATKTAIK